MNYRNEREEVAYFMRRLYDKNLTTTSGGNISFRTDDNIVLLTPSALDKGKLQGNQILAMTLEGKNLNPELKPTIEGSMHLAIYRKHTDIKAVVHAHPCMATSFTAMKTKINTKLIAESRAILGEPVYTDYELQGTPELAEIVSEAVKQSDVILMANHGVLCVANTLLAAFDKVEVLEAAAKITLLTSLFNDKEELPARRIYEIDKLFKHL